MPNTVEGVVVTRQRRRGPVSRALDSEGRDVLDSLLALMNATGPLHGRLDKKESTNRSAPLTNDGRWRRFRAQVRHLIGVNRCAGEGAAAAELNRLFSQYCSAPRIVTHDSTKPHLHFAPVDASAQSKLFADTVAALANLSMHGELWRLRSCESPICTRVFLDRSPNGSRTFCRIGPCLQSRRRKASAA
jgi:predicted RNA-binding Zn ribbon-like protein